jgi:hypothetical protein
MTHSKISGSFLLFIGGDKTCGGLVEETWVVLHDAAEDCCSTEYSWIDRSSVPHGQLMHFTENIGQTSQENVTRIQWFPLKTYLLNLLFY